MNIIKNSFPFILLLFILSSCDEKDSVDIGGNLVDGKVEGYKEYIDLLAYNINNNDTIRADFSVLDSSSIGVYSDNVFGKLKASFATQIRLNANNSEIASTIQKVDSVILYIYPAYNVSNKTSKTEQFLIGNITYTREIIDYPITSIIGERNQTLSLKVEELTTALESGKIYYSNEIISTGKLLGTKDINDYASVTVIKNKAGGDSISIPENDPPSIKIALDTNFFKTEFFDKKIAGKFPDNASFLQEFNGIKISANSDDAKFIFTHNLKSMKLIAYYTGDNEPKQYSFNIASSTSDDYKAVVGEYKNEIPQDLKNKLKSPNKTEGDELIYLKGMGGPTAHIRLNDLQVEAIKDSVKNKGWIIMGAKLKLYAANDKLPKPYQLFAYNSTDSELFKNDVYRKGTSTINSDFNPTYKKDEKGSEFYEINLTYHLKNILEKEGTNTDIIVGIGNFTKKGDILKGAEYTSRSYNPNGLVIHGNKATSEDQKLKLEIIYSK